VLRFSVFVLLLAMAVQVYRVSRATADFLRDRFGARTLAVDLRSDRPGLAKLYWNTGKGYNEADSASAPVRGGKRWQRLRFPVPPDPLLAVRLDPLRSEGRIEIRMVQLQSGSGRSRLDLDLETVRPGVQVKEMTVEQGILRAVFPVGAGDPHLQFGRIVPDGSRGSGSLPWMGYGSVAAILFLLFLLRKHSSAAVLAIRAVRYSVSSWILELRAIDRPGKATLLVGGMVVVGLQIFLLYPLHQVIDLPIWDEAETMGGGLRFLQGDGLGYLADSPLSKLIYAGLIGVFGPAGSIFASHYLVKTGLVLVLFLFSARVAGSVLAGVALSSVWALSSFQLEFPILTYQSALIWFGLGLLSIGRSRFLGLSLIVLAALTRLDYQFVAFLAAGFLTVRLLAGGRDAIRLRKSQWALVAVVLGVATVVLFNLSGWNSGMSRGWYAVKQHYALRLAREGAFPGNNAFLEFALVTDRDFPEADSLWSALRVNPRALVDHVWWNVRHLPGAFLDLFVPSGSAAMPYRFPFLVLGLVVMTGLIACFRAPGECLRKLRLLVSKDPVVGVALLGALLVIAPGVIVFAKSAYLLPILPLGLALVGVLYRFGSKYEVINRFGILCALALVLTALLSGPRPFLDRSRPRPVLATLAAIESALPRSESAVLLGVSAGSYANYLGPQRVVGVEPLASALGGEASMEDARFGHLIEQYDPDLIMIDSNWRRSAYFDATGAAELAHCGWREWPLPDGALWTRK